RISLSNAEASSLRGANVRRWTLRLDERRSGRLVPLDDEPITPLPTDERPDPLEEDAQPEPRLGEREDVDQGPREPGDERLEMQLAALEDRDPGTAPRHGSAIRVAERPRRALPGHATGDRLPCIVTLLERHLRHARKRSAILGERGGVADDEDLREARNREV